MIIDMYFTVENWNILFPSVLEYCRVTRRSSNHLWDCLFGLTKYLLKSCRVPLSLNQQLRQPKGPSFCPNVISDNALLRTGYYHCDMKLPSLYFGCYEKQSENKTFPESCG